MSIPYNDYLNLDIYQLHPNWHQFVPAPVSNNENQACRALKEVGSNLTVQPVVRGVQAIRDLARLVLKVPIRAVATPVCLEKNWAERERAAVNAKLTGYAWVQLACVPPKLIVALVALGVAMVSEDGARLVLDTSENWTAHLDGRASQLEALKEEGAKKLSSQEEFDKYRAWLYSIDAKLCRKEK
jgi:hypothetical protein